MIRQKNPRYPTPEAIARELRRVAAWITRSRPLTEEVLAVLADDGPLSGNGIRDVVGRRSSAVIAALRDLAAANVIEHTSSGWRLK